MSLDKQRILSELGSVMNQLQGADCGCMGKLFSNPGQESQGNSACMPNYGGCRRGCCQGHVCGGDVGANRPCMGRCNPPQLYADTYSHLNQNLMQPVVQEVYNDLNSISPANTVGNNPLATQMGLGQGSNSMMKGNVGAMGSNQMSGGMDNGNQQMGMAANPGGMGGMGAQIMNMMSSSGGGRAANMPPQGGNLQEPMLIDAPHSPHGQIGVTPFNPAMGGNQGQFGGGNMGMSPMGQGEPIASRGQENMAQMQAPVTQYVTQDNMYGLPNAMPGNMGHNRVAQSNPGAQGMKPGAQGMNPGFQSMNPGTQEGGMNPNLAAQMPNARSSPYGQHSQGVKKFNDMFPGVMQGGDLGFDPMAIALQMNPANQKRTAMETMQKLMSNKPAGSTAPAAHANANMGQSSQPQQLMQNQPNQMAQQQMPQSQQGLAQQSNPNDVQPNQPQVYTALTGAPTMNQQVNGQRIIDPNSGDALDSDPNTNTQQPPSSDTAHEMYKEPIFPADTSSNPPVQRYNTLGQPVNMLPGYAYRTQDPGLPQTLSLQPTSKTRNDVGYLGVKGTMSKTSLIGNRPMGKTPSRSQLQQIYHQYKGSQSYTQQNIGHSGQGGSQSDGRLNVTPESSQPMAMERVAGDSAANNNMNQFVSEVGQTGDVAAAHKPRGDVIDKTPTVKPARCRNGLQDMMFTSGPSNAAWSFHGDGLATAYRTRTRY